MNRMKIVGVSKWFAAAVFPLVIAVAPAWGQSSSQGSGWQYSIMPYLWLPTMEGSLRYGPPATGGATPNVSVDADTLLGALDFAMMLTA